MWLGFTHGEDFFVVSGIQWVPLMGPMDVGSCPGIRNSKAPHRCVLLCRVTTLRARLRDAESRKSTPGIHLSEDKKADNLRPGS